MNLKDIIKTKFKEHTRFKKDMLSILDDLYFEEIGGMTKFNPYPIQKKVMQLFLKYHYIIINKSRQTGISTIFTIICAILLVLYPKYTIGVISKDKDAACEFIARIKSILIKLPDQLRPSKFPEDNKKSLKLPNGSKVIADCVSMSAPDKTLRSHAISLLIMDEAAFIDKIHIAFAGIRPTLSKTEIICKQKNIPYGIAIISTPNGIVGKGEWFFEMWSKANKYKNAGYNLEEFPYIPVEVRWQMIPGYDMKWYRAQCAAAKNKREIAQELDLKFVGDSECEFEDHIIEQIQESTEEATIINKISVIKPFDENERVEPSTFKKCTLNLYSEIDTKRKYFIGCDVATKYGQCNSAIEITDAETGFQVGEFRHSLTVDHLYYALVNIMDLFPNNLTIFENNSIGNQLIEYFERDVYKYNFGNIYIDRLFKEYVIDKKSGRTTDEYKLGFTNTKKTRPLIMDSLYNIVSETPHCIKSNFLGFELIQLRSKNGKLMKANGSFDDACLAFAYCAYAYMYRPHMKVNYSDLNNITNDEDINLDCAVKMSRDLNYNVNQCNNKNFNSDIENARKDAIDIFKGGW